MPQRLNQASKPLKFLLTPHFSFLGRFERSGIEPRFLPYLIESGDFSLSATFGLFLSLTGWSITIEYWNDPNVADRKKYTNRILLWGVGERLCVSPLPPVNLGVSYCIFSQQDWQGFVIPPPRKHLEMLQRTSETYSVVEPRKKSGKRVSTQ
jgi:hypothetical protein